MSDVIAYIIAGCAAIVAALFGGAWLSARKQRDAVLTDHRDLARQASIQRIKIAELTIRQREQDAIRKNTLEGIKGMRRNANSSSPADDFAARIRGDGEPD